MQKNGTASSCFAKCKINGDVVCLCSHASKRSRSSPSDITSDISPAKIIPNCAACKTYTKMALQIAYHQHAQSPCRSGAAYDFPHKKTHKKLDISLPIWYYFIVDDAVN